MKNFTFNEVFISCQKCNHLPKISFTDAPENLTLVLAECSHCDATEKIDMEVFINEYNKKITEIKNDTIPCSNRNHFILGESYCLHCDNWLCRLCKRNHGLDSKNHLILNKEIKISSRCVYHLHKKIKYYCEYCEQDLCEICAKGFAKHRHHKIINLSDSYSPSSVSKIKNDFTKAHKFLEKEKKNYSLVLQKIPSYSKDSYKSVEKSYQKFQRVNELYLKFANILYEFYLKTASIPSYEIVKSLSTFTKFDFSSFEISHTSLAQATLFYETAFFLNPMEEENLLSMTNQANLQQTIPSPNCSRVNHIARISDGRLCSSFSCGTMVIFSKEFSFDIVIEDFEECVNYFSTEKDNKILACSSDYQIIEFSIFEKTYAVNFVISNAHTNYINQVIYLSNNRIASCSNDETIKIRSRLSPNEEIETLYNDNYYIVAITELVTKNLLVSCSSDEIVRFWNLESYSCVGLLENVYCSSSSSLFEASDYRVLVGGFGSVVVIDPSNITIEKTIYDEELGDIRSFCQLDDRSVLFGGGLSGNPCVVYSLNISVLKYKIIIDNAHRDKVTGLCLVEKPPLKGDHFICTGSREGKIKVWEVD